MPSDPISDYERYDGLGLAALVNRSFALSNIRKS
jgi:hypothetical protein